MLLQNSRPCETCCGKRSGSEGGAPCHFALDVRLYGQAQLHFVVMIPAALFSRLSTVYRYLLMLAQVKFAYCTASTSLFGIHVCPALTNLQIFCKTLSEAVADAIAARPIWSITGVECSA